MCDTVCRACNVVRNAAQFVTGKVTVPLMFPTPGPVWRVGLRLDHFLLPLTAESTQATTLLCEKQRPLRARALRFSRWKFGSSSFQLTPARNFSGSSMDAPSPLRAALAKARKPVIISIALCTLFSLGVTPLMAAVSDPDSNAQVRAVLSPVASPHTVYFFSICNAPSTAVPTPALASPPSISYVSPCQRLLVLVGNYDEAGSGVGTSLITFLEDAAAAPHAILAALPNFTPVEEGPDVLATALREGHAWAVVWVNQGATANLSSALAAAEGGTPLAGTLTLVW